MILKFRSFRQLLAPEDTIEFSLDDVLKTDLFGIGSTIHFLITGKQLIQGRDADSVMYYNEEFDVDYLKDQKHYQKFNPECLKLVKSILKTITPDRPSAAECLKSPWFSEFYAQNTSNLNNKRFTFNKRDSLTPGRAESTPNTRDNRIIGGANH